MIVVFGRSVGIACLTEAKRIQIGIVKNKTQADRFACELAQFLLIVPGDRAIQSIAEDRRAILKRKSNDWCPIGMLDGDANAPGSRRGEIQ